MEDTTMLKETRKSYNEEEFELDNQYNEEERYRSGEPSVWYS